MVGNLHLLLIGGGWDVDDKDAGGGAAAAAGSNLSPPSPLHNRHLLFRWICDRYVRVV